MAVAVVEAEEDAGKHAEECTDDKPGTYSITRR